MAPNYHFYDETHNAGATMFIIDEGAVEIRIGDGPGGKATRLAAFGPGSIFGEIALLTSDKRTADAVCLKATRLYELSRDAFAALETRSPQLYARILANLNAHLANRLIIATGIVESRGEGEIYMARGQGD